jgi:hypothetical protein
VGDTKGSDAGDSGAAGKPGDKSGDKPDSYFLQRWSQRKTASRKGKTDLDPLSAPTPADRPVAEAATADEADPRSELTDADMPPIESLDKDSDFSVFMSPKVSDQLRTQALRKLFHLPAFNITDGLNDYDEDYTQFAGLGGVVTHEMKRLLKRELEAKAASGEAVQPVAQGEAPLSEDDVAENDAGMDDDAGEQV